MEWDDEIDLNRRKITSQLIVKRCIERGWKIGGFKTNPAVFLIYPPGKTKPVTIFSASPPQMSYPASKVAADKYVTNRVLELAGLPVPDELLVHGDPKDLAEDLKKFIKQHARVVVKPLDASHGHGVTVDVTGFDELVKAVEVARNEGNGQTVIIQQQISGVDVRVNCLDYMFSDSISRIPASVIGDGKHTIRQLIEIVNSSEDRGANYSSKLNTISVDKVEAWMGKEAITRIPSRDEEVQVIGISNVGAGGVRYNIKKDIPPFLQELATQAAKTLGLPVCGIDFMVKRLPQAGDTFEDLQPAIIEANSCPSLAMYDDLESPEQIALLDDYLDYLAKAPQNP